MKPYLGAALPDALGWVCAHSSTPGRIECPADAVWHGLVLTHDRTGLRALLSSCDEHRAAMAITADYIHRMDSACGLDEAMCYWKLVSGDSWCAVDWDAVAPLAVELAVPVTL